MCLTHVVHTNAWNQLMDSNCWKSTYKRWSKEVVIEYEVDIFQPVWKLHAQLHWNMLLLPTLNQGGF